MKITAEWLDSIAGENGLSNGQKKLLEIWRKRTNDDGTLPDQVANFMLGCKGYYSMQQYMIDRLSNENFNRHMRLTLP